MLKIYALYLSDQTFKDRRIFKFLLPVSLMNFGIANRTKPYIIENLLTKVCNFE